MEIQFSWEITSIKCNDEDNFSDVVKEIDWICSATDGTKTIEIKGTKRMPKASENFIPYNNLSIEQVLNWVWENGLHEAAQAHLIKRFNEIEIQFVEKPFPWM